MRKVSIETNNFVFIQWCPYFKNVFFLMVVNPFCDKTIHMYIPANPETSEIWTNEEENYSKQGHS